MEKIVKVALDAMGGDNAPGEIVKGAVDAVNENSNIKVYLVGKSPRIHEELKKYRYKSEQIEVINAEEEISCDESPVEAIRKKKTAPALVKCSKCGELMMPHRVCKACGSYNKREIVNAQ